MAHAQPVPTPPGIIQGIEVLGFDTGRFHSWLCYSLLGQAIDKLGIRANDRGLLTTLLEAQQVTDMANSNRGTYDGTPEDVTWFPALITEYDTEQPVPSNSPVRHTSHSGPRSLSTSYASPSGPVLQRTAGRTPGRAVPVRAEPFVVQLTAVVAGLE
ncbi:hypothetical protein GCM10027280_38050 [Micromonospora polyrhachis]|uniref:Uncharacterized protein n=1 Tax=Micromonospora polyrhachis TaxID=1282883 RepID=A0A7W7SWT9_9ACTN|nr:hypothetical protein [Micromonospora polyrhachis]MBB4962394.1 hypothetical protein [Micromonospora polyrhachis]